MSNVEQLWEPALTVPAPAAAIGEPRWYAIRTRGRQEKKVTTQLRDKGVRTFLPLIAHTHRWSDRRKTAQLALFPSYTFVRLEAWPETRFVARPLAWLVLSAFVAWASPYPAKK